MSGFDVDPIELDDAAGFVGATGANLRRQLLALTAMLDDLLGGSWRGVAASGFCRAWGEWESGALEMVGALETMSALLRDSGATYQASEDASVLTS